MANPFISAKTRLDSLAEEKEEIIKKAANAVAKVLESYNDDGVTSLKNITDDLNKLLVNFNDSEKVEILTRVTALLVANL